MVLEYEHIEMKPADNGVIISYTEKKHNPGAKGMTYAECCYDHKQMVFSMEDIDKAFDKFKKMCEYNKMKKGAY